MSATASNDNLVALADARLEREYDDRHRRLMVTARRCYKWLSEQDCEDLANDTLIAWYRMLRTTGVEFDDTFCGTVLRREAITRLRRRIWARAHMIDLSEVEDTGIDPQLDVVAGEREEARQLSALARQILSGQELRMLWLLACGYRRREISEHVGLSDLEVKTSLHHARRQLRRERDLDPRLAA